MADATQAGSALAAPGAGSGRAEPARARAGAVGGRSLLGPVRAKALAGSEEFVRFGPGAWQPLPMTATAGNGLYNFLCAVEDEPHEPDAVFARLRWGGQFVYAARSGDRVRDVAARFVARGFELARGPAMVRGGWLGFSWLGRPVHYFIARRVRLTLPREISERFTYSVRLVDNHPSTRDWVVLKEIPSVERVSARLAQKFPDAAPELIEKRARKFTEKIFPLFLTREAAMLKILERDLPKAYSARVPRAIGLEQDGRGYVRRLWMNWLRAAPPQGRPLTQLEFALQATDLVRVMHEKAGVIHLDLRLDNVVITEDGVGFVDFGSAVRVGENIQGNPLLATIFDELMRTSQIQRMLERMTLTGAVTSPILNAAYGKVDKAVDLFYLAVQINAPLANPDFAGLVQFNPASEQAAALSRVTQDVLKPKDPNCPTVKCAADLLRLIERVGRRDGPERAAREERVPAAPK